MADKFSQFVLNLASDPQALAQFQKQPDAAASNAGLSPAEVAVLKSGDPNLVRQAVMSGLGTTAQDASDLVVVVVITMPSPSVQLQGLLAKFKTTGTLGS
jgi:hypothetical protein